MTKLQTSASISMASDLKEHRFFYGLGIISFLAIGISSLESSHVADFTRPSMSTNKTDLLRTLFEATGLIGCAAMALQETMRVRGVLPDMQTGASS